MHSNIVEGINHIKRARPLDNDYSEAITLDECMFAVSKQLCKELKFDEKCCSGWNFYCVDLCYENMLRGANNFIVSTNAHHESLGNINRNFEKDLKLLIKKYRNKLDKIITPCVKIDCNYKAYWLYIYKHRRNSLITKIEQLFKK